MTSHSRKKPIVPYSDDDEEVSMAPSPPVKHNGRKRTRPVSSSPEPAEDEDSPGSLVDFIDDEAEEEDDDVDDAKPSITPPSHKREPAKFPIDSDDEGVAVSSSYEADLVESPKKWVVKSSTQLERRHKGAVDKASSDMTKPLFKKAKQDVDSSDRRQHSRQSLKPQSKHDSREQLSTKPQATMPVKKRSTFKKDESEDESSVEVVEPVKAVKIKTDVVSKPTPSKDRQTTRDHDSPAKKKKVIKSAETVEDSDSDALGIKADLNKGDSMYPEGRKTKAKAVNLNGLGSTPPLVTRSRSVTTPTPVKRREVTRKQGDTPSQTKQSPAVGNDIYDKKPSSNSGRRTSPDWDEWSDNDQDTVAVPVKVKEPSQSSSRKRNTTDTSAKPSANQSSELNKPTTLDKNLSPATLASDDDARNESENDVFGPQPTGPNSFKARVWKSLPEPRKCQVFDENYLDEFLAARDGYKSNPKLRKCEILTSGTQQYKGLMNGLPRFSSWTRVIKENFEALARAFNFVSDNRYINLSRISPQRLAARKMTETRFDLCIDNKTALCFSTACVGESHLFTLQPQLGRAEWTSKFIKVRLHQYEHYRFASVIGEVARRSVFHTTIWNQAISFGTKLTRREEAQQILNGGNVPDDFFDTYVSPQKKSSKTNASSTDHPLLKDHIPALEFSDEVPVYDARGLPEDFNWTANVFSKLDKHFSRFNAAEFPDADPEIPINSLVGLGYTVQYYRQGLYNNANSNSTKGKARLGVKAEESEPQDLNVNLMLQWVLVLGVRS